jgi:hypothetical protein
MVVSIRSLSRQSSRISAASSLIFCFVTLSLSFVCGRFGSPSPLA